MAEMRALEIEINAIRASGLLGERGRLRRLFDYLAGRVNDASSPKESELAVEVFDKKDVAGDDATVRVYIHRLRKKLEEFYSETSSDSLVRLTLPLGEYRLVLEERGVSPQVEQHNVGFKKVALIGAAALLILNLGGWGFFTYKQGLASPASMTLNPIWSQLHASPRPIIVVVGDYFLFSEQNTYNYRSGRLVRDFLVNSAVDLEKSKRDYPQAFANAKDIGLQYLPLSVAYALRDIAPLIQRSGQDLQLIPASKADARILKDYNVVYIGLLSSLGFLRTAAFMNSPYTIGISFDEVIDTRSGEVFESGEMEALSEGGTYNDYGYFAFRRTPDNNFIVIVAGTRDTGLRGVAEMVSQGQLPRKLKAALVRQPSYEALLEINGQNQVNITSTIISVN